jgi:hypothetical protein
MALAALFTTENVAAGYLELLSIVLRLQIRALLVLAVDVCDCSCRISRACARCNGSVIAAFSVVELTIVGGKSELST